MVSKAKVNYTPDQEKIMLEMYNPESPLEEREAQVKAICKRLGKEIRSVKGKLSSMKVFVRAKPVSKVTGEAPAKKEEIAQQLVTLAGVNGDGKSLNPLSLEKCNKTDLQFLINLITELQAAQDSKD